MLDCYDRSINLCWIHGSSMYSDVEIHRQIHDYTSKYVHLQL